MITQIIRQRGHACRFSLWKKSLKLCFATVFEIAGAKLWKGAGEYL